MTTAAAATAVAGTSGTVVAAGGFAIDFISYNFDKTQHYKHSQNHAYHDICNVILNKFNHIFPSGHYFLKNPIIILRHMRHSTITTPITITSVLFKSVQIIICLFYAVTFLAATTVFFLFGSGLKRRYSVSARIIIAATVPAPKASSPVISPPN